MKSIDSSFTSSWNTSSFGCCGTDSLSSNPNWAEKINLAWKEQNFDEALILIDEYLDNIVPLVNDILIILGLAAKSSCHLAMGRYEQALDFAEQAQEKYISHQATLADLAGSSKYDQANGCLNQYKGMLLLNLGREEEAIQILRENPPTDSWVRDIYQKIEAKLGIELFDPNEITDLSDYNDSFSSFPFSPSAEFTGGERVIYEKLIGEWLRK